MFAEVVTSVTGWKLLLQKTCKTSLARHQMDEIWTLTTTVRAIGAGDVLQILVWKEPEASVSSVVVRTDGKITVPFVKEIEVAGMTPAELEKILAGKFTKYIRDLDVTSVTVVPKEILSQKVYLLGAVKKEGPVPLKSSMTVLQALNEAGGLTEYAKRKKIYVLRNDGGKQIRLPFDYTAVIHGEHPEQNILVRAEDTVVVP